MLQKLTHTTWHRLLIRILAFALLVSMAVMSLSFRPTCGAVSEDWDGVPKTHASFWQWWLLQQTQQAEDLPIEDIHAKSVAAESTVQHAFKDTDVYFGSSAEVFTQAVDQHRIYAFHHPRNCSLRLPGYYHFLHLYTPF
jgi:hypothetical protein